MKFSLKNKKAPAVENELQAAESFAPREMDAHVAESTELTENDNPETFPSPTSEPVSAPNAGKPSKETAAMLKKAGEEGRLVLRTDNLVKKYRQRTVANHVSIELHQGEIVGLLGPNGAGKTTTFYMTTGLVTPNEGRVFLNDVDITKLPVYKRAKLGIGYLPQEASVFRTLTVENNIRTVLEMTDTTPEYQRDKLEELIAEFHLEKVRKNLGNRLSGGERRARCERGSYGAPGPVDGYSCAALWSSAVRACDRWRNSL